MFRTVITPGENKYKIDLSDRILCIGSCFADMVGHKLRDHKFEANVNPFGVIFNPESVFNLLNYCIDKRFPPSNTYLKNQGVYYNYEFHSDFGDLDNDRLKNRIEEAIENTTGFLSNTKWLILTFGTAVIYQKADDGKTVANCHKMPSNLFHKKLLTDKEIIAGFKLLMDKLKGFNPDVRIMLTVSPVRHIKEGLELNTVSKSILRVACHQLADTIPQLAYFPGYEIMMDDLRDYRFYKRDMVHPSEEAEDYIWNIFGQNYFSPEVRAFIAEWDKIQKSLSHRPFHPRSENHRNFLKKLLMQLHAISCTVDVSAEIEAVQRKLESTTF